MSGSLFSSLRCLIHGHNFIRVGVESWHGNLGNPVYELATHRCERCGCKEPLPV